MSLSLRQRISWFLCLFFYFKLHVSDLICFLLFLDTKEVTIMRKCFDDTKLFNRLVEILSTSLFWRDKFPILEIKIICREFLNLI